MFKNIWQILILIIITSFLALLQFSFISSLPSPFCQINLLLIVLIFTLFFLDFRTALISALIAGFWLDLMSFSFFGLYLIVFFICLFFAEWILKNLLTNRSFYSLLAIMTGITFFYNFLVATLFYIFSAEKLVFFLWQKSFWLTTAYQCLWSLLSAVILFNLAVLVSKRIKPFFLDKKSLV
ncbi:rod shape-determining protein MreD [Candidatus Falkowbacteria bacterium]|jgi:rod shape-determining protein MreD|nr:rod shape-determining protein MreD [Candidatus Falkowbacteria bacterium]